MKWGRSPTQSWGKAETAKGPWSSQVGGVPPGWKLRVGYLEVVT